VPVGGQRAGPVLEVRVDHRRVVHESEDFGGGSGGLGLCEEEVGACAQVGQVDGDEGEAVGGVFGARCGRADPAVGSREVGYGNGALDAACDLERVGWLVLGIEKGRGKNGGRNYVPSLFGRRGRLGRRKGLRIGRCRGV
jgi:hypothetical protein